jgi:hypothetical protein
VDLRADLNVDSNLELSDSVPRHLREVVDLPDLTGTRYQLQGKIGRGGLGVVYAARDTQLDRRVALKVMDAAWLEKSGTQGVGDLKDGPQHALGPRIQFIADGP